MYPIQLLKKEIRTSDVDDAVLKRMFDASVALLESNCGRLVRYREDYVQTFTKPEGLSVWVNLMPVVSATVKEWDDDETKPTDPLDATLIRIDKVGGRIDRLNPDRSECLNRRVDGQIIPSWKNNVEVTMTGGYTDDDWKTDPDAATIVNACILQTKFSLARNSQTRIASASTGMQRGSSSSHLVSATHPEFDLAVKGYRRHVVG